MRGTYPFLAVVLFLVSLAPVEAAGGHTPARTMQKTFRLSLSARPSSDMTFWVAYGPLAGRFGIIRMHPTGPTSFSATMRLPASGRTTFAYVTGYGVMSTRFGLAPGNPVSTIRVFPSVTVTTPLPLVRWQMPVG